MLLVKRKKGENISQERWNKPRIISSGSFVYLKHSLLSCLWLHRSFSMFLMHTRNKKSIENISTISWYIIEYTIILTAILYGQISAQKVKAGHILLQHTVLIFCFDFRLFSPQSFKNHDMRFPTKTMESPASIIPKLILRSWS